MKIYNFDKETKLLVKDLRNKLISYETIVLLKFLENITRTTHSLTIHLQSKELNILSSIELIDSSLKLIKHMRNDDQSLKNILVVGISLPWLINIMFKVIYFRVVKNVLIYITSILRQNLIGYIVFINDHVKLILINQQLFNWQGIYESVAR